MMCLTKWISTTLAIALMASTAAAADTIGSGKVKSINADKKTFVLIDSYNKKDYTFKFGDHLIVNREGKESKSDLKAGDWIDASYDKGTFTWTAHYILVRAGKSEHSDLIRGSVKSYDADKKELTITNEDKKDATYVMGKAMVRVNMEATKIENIKIGDHALIIVETVGKTATLRSVMVERK